MLIGKRERGGGNVQEILIAIAAGVAPVIVLSVGALLTASVRNVLFYVRAEYDFAVHDGQGPTKWDIQWEGYRLTIKVGDVHNNYLEAVEVIEQDSPPGKLYPHLKVSDKFESLFDGSLQFKLNTIVRTIPTDGEKIYQLRFVLRRRR